MNEQQALLAFRALSQETRLRIIRLLVIAGPHGLPAGEIAEKAEGSPSNVSFHLKELERAGLATPKRESRSIRYSACYDTLGSLVRFILEDCCSGHPEICIPVLDFTTCCTPATKGQIQ